MANRRYNSRKSGFRPARKVVVIATEGKVTERRYFDALNKQITETNFKRIKRRSNRTHPMQVLDDRIAFKNAHSEKYLSDTSYWLIIDRERRPSSEMTKLANKAKENGCILADSNPCFEVWLFQHYRTITSVKGLAGQILHGGCSKMIDHLRKQPYDPSYDKSKYRVANYLARLEPATANAKTDDTDCGESFLAGAGSRVYRVVESAY